MSLVKKSGGVFLEGDDLGNLQEIDDTIAAKSATWWFQSKLRSTWCTNDQAIPN